MPSEPSGPPKVDFEKALELLVKTEPEMKTFKQDTGQKAFRLESKKTLNLKVGQVSATLKSMQECARDLNELLKRYAQDPCAMRSCFIAFSLAERLADEAEVGVKAQARSAWPKARVAAQVFAASPTCWQFFQGLMCKACPYLAPGRQGPSSGDPGRRPGEAYTSFADRMVGYLRLWMAVLVVQGDLAEIWRWLACTLNRAPTAVVAPMLHAALETGGADAQARYKRQFVKVVTYVRDVYVRELETLQPATKGEEADQLRASLSRLRLWLEKFQATGRAPLAEGQSVSVAEEAELNPNI